MLLKSGPRGKLNVMTFLFRSSGHLVCVGGKNTAWEAEVAVKHASTADSSALIEGALVVQLAVDSPVLPWVSH